VKEIKLCIFWHVFVSFYVFHFFTQHTKQGVFWDQNLATWQEKKNEGVNNTKKIV
jgi:hypothetical protein